MAKKFDSRKSDVITFREGMGNLLKHYQLEQKYDEKQLILSWGKILGKPIEDRTEKLFIKDKKLFAKLSSAPLRHELSMTKSKILELFRKEFGHDIITDIVFL